MGPAARAAPSAEPFKTCARARARLRLGFSKSCLLFDSQLNRAGKPPNASLLSGFTTASYHFT